MTAAASVSLGAAKYSLSALMAGRLDSPGARGGRGRHTRLMSEDSWPSRHFSIANPRDKNPTDLPALLRQVAGEVKRQQIKPDDVQVVNIDSELTENGPWWSATMVWSKLPAAEPQAERPTP